MTFDTFDHCQGLLQSLSSMLEGADDHDVIIRVGENQEEFRAHSNILRARSKYFKDLLSTDSINEKNSMIKITNSAINPNVFKIILKYAYIGEVSLLELPNEFILELLVAPGELHLEELFEYVQDHLIEYRTSWVKQNLIQIIHKVFPLFICEKLQDHCIETISADPQSFIILNDFLSLDKNILYELLKRNDLQIEEIIIWDYLIKWGIEQTPGLGSENSDRIKWNDENYEALKNTLSQFIPFIRFSEISSADFYDKVYPFKAVIPDHVYDKVLLFYMKGTNEFLPPRIRKISIESKIIKPELAYIIANWIEGKDAKAIRRGKDLQYKFNLLYRRSRDGLDINTFRNKCEHQGQCLILIETSHVCNAVNDSFDVQQNDNRRSSQVDTTSDGWGPPPTNCTDNGGWGPYNNNDDWDSFNNNDGWSSFNNNGDQGSLNNDDGWGPANNNDDWGSNSVWDTTLDEISRDSSSISLWQTSDPPRSKATDQKSLAQNLTKIYGEYKLDPLMQNGWRCATENFIFSFTNDEDVKDMKICRMNYNKFDLNHGNKFDFSNTFRMNGADIEVDNSVYNDKNVINSNIKKFSPKEIEVFQVQVNSRSQ